MNKTLQSLPTIHPEEISRKGMEIYQRAQRRLEKSHYGEYVAIEVDSGKYFLGKTLEEATVKAKNVFPTKIFYFVKVGFPAVFTFSGHQPLSYGNAF